MLKAHINIQFNCILLEKTMISQAEKSFTMAKYRALDAEFEKAVHLHQ